ncbi:hypothetical protein [Larkinella arboricola]
MKAMFRVGARMGLDTALAHRVPTKATLREQHQTAVDEQPVGNMKSIALT